MARVKQVPPQSSFFQRNKTLLITLAIIAVILLMLISWVTGTYNGLVTERENVKGQFGNVDVQYQRRADLVPNLVQVVGAYAKQERTVLEAVTQARASVGRVQVSAADLSDPQKLEQFQDAQAELGGALSRLLVVAENYPELRSNENFRDLQAQLEGTENRIAVARRDYQGAVQSYNVRVQRFPTAIIASMFNFEQAAYFSADDGAQTVPAINKDDLVQ